MARMLPVAILGAAAAAVLGFVLGHATAPAPAPPEPVKPAPPRDDGKDREIAGLRRRVGELEQSLRGAARPKEPPAETSSAERKLRELVKEDVSAERQQQVAALAARFRAEAQAASESADARAAQQVSDEIARERRVREDAERGGPMTLIRKIHESKTFAPDLVGSAFEFGKLFGRAVEGPLVEGPSNKPEAGLADGSTVRFPAGYFNWSLRDVQRTPAFPADLVIEGAGMDATILRSSQVSTTAEIRSLTFRDLTLDTDGFMTDLRSSEPATIRLERCRVVGFDSGAGGSNMLDARVAALYATDSRFETGFGRAPKTGNLVDARGGTILARFERCTIAGPMYEPGFRTSESTTIVFAECRFLDMGAKFVKAMETPPNGVRFTGCTTETRDPAAAAEERRRFLSGVTGTEASLAEMRRTYSRVLADPANPK